MRIRRGFFFYLFIAITIYSAFSQSNSSVKTEWVEKIQQAPNHKVMAFRYGPELMKLDPKVSAEIAQAAWPQSTNKDVKTGILKTFFFNHHPEMLAILDLGMNDQNVQVQNYAKGYLFSFTLQTFNLSMQSYDADISVYKAWYQSTERKSLDKIQKACVFTLAKDLSTMKPAQGMTYMEKLGFPFYDKAKNTTEKKRIEYAVEAGIPSIFRQWQSDPKLTEYHAYKLLQCRARLCHTPEFIEMEIIPIIHGHKHANLCHTAIKIISDSSYDKKTDFLIEELQKCNPENQRRKLRSIARALGLTIKDSKAIPTMIGVIDADNSRDTIENIGYALEELTQVKYSAFHDGAWWKKWWQENKKNYPKEVQNIPIPELPKTEHGKTYVPYPPEMQSIEGQLKALREQYESMQLKGLMNSARAIADLENPAAIPLMIGIIDADNSYDTNYGVGYFGLYPLTKVNHSSFHDGTWWKRWWKENKKNYPKEVQDIPIPELPKSEQGKSFTPYPENIFTFEGIRAYLPTMIRSGKLNSPGAFINLGSLFFELNDDRTIPLMIGLIEMDNTNSSINGIGYFGMKKITGVSYNEKHDGAWWRKWWRENRSKYSTDVQKIAIPDYSKEFAEGKIAAKKHAFAGSLTIKEYPEMKYFAMGPKSGKQEPENGYKLAIIMPGGGGGPEFHPFVKQIYQSGLGEDWIAVQPIAFKWTEKQVIVWPTRKHKVKGQHFATEDFIEEVISDVKKRHKINTMHIITLTWSSSGPAAYAASLTKDSSITGSYISMSVFKPKYLPSLKNAEGHRYYIEHSKDDRICPYRMAKDAEKRLSKKGAEVQFSDYTGGHGWHGNIYQRIRKGMDWLTRE